MKDLPAQVYFFADSLATHKRDKDLESSKNNDYITT